MRIVLKEGKQKELILQAKKLNNFSWIELSQQLKTGKNYLSNELNNEKRTLSKEAYEILCRLSNLNFEEYIQKRLEDSWGRSKGGINSTRKETLLIDSTSKELAEFMGIMLGDGNVWVRKGGYHYITIAGNYLKDKEYLETYVNPLFRRLFSKDMQIHKNSKNNGMFLKIGDKDIVYTLNHWGFPSGNKKKNNVTIPSWISDNKEYLKCCVRGLIDTDGSVFPIKGRKLPYIWFSSNIEGIQKSFSSAMKSLGFDISKWNIREGHAAECYIAKKEHVVSFLKEVGFSNSKHRKMFLPLSSRGQILSLR